MNGLNWFGLCTHQSINKTKKQKKKPFFINHIFTNQRSQKFSKNLYTKIDILRRHKSVQDTLIFFIFKLNIQVKGTERKWTGNLPITTSLLTIMDLSAFIHQLITKFRRVSEEISEGKKTYSKKEHVKKIKSFFGQDRRKIYGDLKKF